MRRVAGIVLCVVLLCSFSCMGAYQAHHAGVLTKQWVDANPDFVKQWAVATGKAAVEFTFDDLPEEEKPAIKAEAKKRAEEDIKRETQQAGKGGTEVATGIATGNYVGAGLGLLSLLGLAFGVGKKLKGGKA